MAASPPSTITFSIWSPIERDDLPGLCRRVLTLLDQSDAAIAVCDVAGIPADLVSVDALARLQLAVRRHHCLIRLRGASDQLRELVAFMGLEDVIGT